MIKKAAKKTIPDGNRKTIFRAGMQSVNLSIELSSGRQLKFSCYNSASQASHEAEGLMVQGSSKH